MECSAVTMFYDWKSWRRRTTPTPRSCLTSSTVIFYMLISCCLLSQGKILRFHIHDMANWWTIYYTFLVRYILTILDRGKKVQNCNIQTWTYLPCSVGNWGADKKSINSLLSIFLCPKLRWINLKFVGILHYMVKTRAVPGIHTMCVCLCAWNQNTTSEKWMIHANTGSPGRLIAWFDSWFGLESSNQSAWAACVYVYTRTPLVKIFWYLVKLVNLNHFQHNFEVSTHLRNPYVNHVKTESYMIWNIQENQIQTPQSHTWNM